MKIDKTIRALTYVPLFIGLISLAHSLYPAGLIFLVILTAATYLDLVVGKPLPGVLLTVCGVLGTLIFAIIAVRMPFEAIAYWIMFLSIIKMLGKKAMRDLKQIIALSFFNFLDSAVFHYSVVFVLYLILYIVAASIALVVITFLDEKKETTLKTEVRSTLTKFGIRFGIGTIIMSIFFFVFLPRSPYVLLRAQVYAPSRKEGFSNELKMGKVEDMNLQDQILLRIKPLNRIKEKVLYVRGIVYNKYEKDTWLRDPEDLPGWKHFGEIKGTRTLRSYSITIEPMNTRVLYAPDYPERIDIRRVAFTPSWGKVFLVAGRNLLQKTQYNSYSSASPDTELPEELDFRDIPEVLTPILDSLFFAENLKGKTAEETANNIKYHFLRNYRYSIEEAPDSNWIQNFIVKKRGHCEYFATLSALLLRRAGIPSRLVGGFLTDEWNRFGSYFVIRTRHAHTWVEYYANGEWVSMDPTPPAAKKGEVLGNLREYVDYLAYLWTTQVLEFSFSNQLKIFLNLRSSLKKLFTGQRILILIACFAGLLLASAALFFIARKFTIKENVATQYFRKFERILKIKGIKIEPGMTAGDIEQIVKSSAAVAFLREYLMCRFSGQCDYQELKRKYENFRKSIS